MTDSRRGLLRMTPNPEGRLDYVVTLKGHIGTTQESRQATVQLSYVPDKFILEDTAFRQYLDALADAEWSVIEELAALILHDLNNEVVARWARVSVARTARSEAAEGSERLHTVTIEDRQPHWDNQELLTRLK